MLNKGKLDKVLNYFEIHGVSHDPKKGLDKVLEFQDLIGYSNVDELKSFIVEISPTYKRLFAFAVLNCLDYDYAMNIIRDVVVGVELNKWKADIDEAMRKEAHEIAVKTAELNKAKKAVGRRVNKLEKRIKQLEGTINLKDNIIRTIREDVNYWRSDAIANKETAHKYHTIKQLLS